jgi:phage terminase small subunit
MQKRCGEAQVSVARVVAELAAVAFPSMKDYAEWDDDGVKLIPSKDLTRDMCRAIQSIKVTHTRDGVNVGFKLHDKLKALEQLGRTLGMFQNEEGKDKLQPLEIMKMLQEFQKSTKDLATEDERTVDGGRETGKG